MRVERWLYSIPLRLRSLFRRSAVESELDEELRFHLEQQIEAHIRHGMSPEAARRAALLAMGGLDLRKEQSRDTRRVSVIENLVRDLRYGARMLTRAPAFASTALLTIALGIGATTAIFSLVYGVVLRPLPFGAPDRLVAIWTSAPRLSMDRAFVGPANARDWRQQNRVFEDLAVVRSGNVNLMGQGEPERLQAALVTANLFPILQVDPLLGRTFTEAEDETGNERVVVLSHGLWQRRFGGDRNIIGQTVMLSDAQHTVVGVMRPDFHFPSRDFQLWVPLTFDPDDFVTRANFSFRAVARLRPGVTVEQAQKDLDVISARLAQQYPGTNADIGAEVAPLLEDTVQPVRKGLYVLLGAVAALLLIGCANLVNLLLARALTRERELAVRAALGASRGRLISQSLSELVPLMLLGGALGLLIAKWILVAMVPLLPADIPRVENIAIHLPVLAFTASTLSVMALGIGLWPALDAARAGLAATIGELSRGSTGGQRRTRVRDGLVVAQMATTLLLLIGAVLLMKSFIGVARVDPGFNPEGVLSAHMAMPRARYQSDDEIARFTERVLERVAAMPSVVSAGMVNRLPLSGNNQNGTIEFEATADDRANIQNVDWRSITPDYFRTMQIPMIEGRSFTAADDADAPRVGIIDAQLAEKLWPGLDAIGRRFRLAIPGQEPGPWHTIVGLAGHVRHTSLEEESRAQVYWNYKQRAQDRMALVVKTRGNAETLAPALSAAVREIDPDQPLYDVRTLDSVLERSLARRWLHTVLLGGFAVLALLLASIGVYGVIAYAVGQRLREFGIRMALGARQADVVALVIGRGARLLALGALLGLIGALAATRLLRSLLHGVQPIDPVSFGVAVLLLAIVGVAACVLPARRAARVSPNQALRYE